MSKLQYSFNKTLKLNNVLIQSVDLMNEELELGFMIEKMQSYIKVRGMIKVGPIVQYIKEENEKWKMREGSKLLLQCNTYICDVEKPYEMKKEFRIPNCMYCRYIGPKDKLGFAYNKIKIEAFENDIELSGESYIVLVEESKEETVMIDVFMPKVEGE